MGVFWGAHIANEVCRAILDRMILTFSQPERIPEAWDAILDMLATKKAKATPYEHIYDGLPSLPDALKDLQDRKTWGKVVVRLKADPLFPPKGSARL